MLGLKSLILTLCFIGLTFAELSPVFIWGAYSESRPALKSISANEFIDLLSPALASKALVVLVESNLKTKDLLCTNVDDGKSCFNFLEDASNQTYYAGVENPIKALRNIAGEYKYHSVDAFGNLPTILKTESGSINFVKLSDDQSSPRESNLRLHDSLLASITSKLNDNVFFIYAPETSESSVKRQRRQVSNSVPGYIFRHESDLLLYYLSITIQHEQTVNELVINSMSVKKNNETSMSVTLSPETGSPLTFDVILLGGYYFMKNVMYNNVIFLSSEVFAPTDFSYFCGNLTLNSVYTGSENDPSYTLKWNSLQFQAPFGNTKNATFVFGDAWHCVGFFTGGILSGLLIVALLLTITFIGICWMMDINTMDRFDDPKGKTITISASD